MTINLGKAAAAAAFICLAVAGLFLSCSWRGHTLRFADRINAGDAAYIRHDYTEAERLYRAALAEAEAEDDGSPSPLIAVAYRHLGNNYLSWGRLAEAEEAFENQLVAVERTSGAESAAMVSALVNMTSVHIAQKDFDKAEAANRRALSAAGALREDSDRVAVAAAVAVARSHEEEIEREKSAR